MQSRQKQNCILDLKKDYSFFFPVALILAQRAFARAESLALAAALIVNFFLAGLAAGLTLAALILAHLAFWAAATLALPAALIPPFFLGALVVGVAAGLAVKPKI